MKKRVAKRHANLTDYRQAVRALKKNVPLAYPVEVRRVAMKDMGTCTRMRNKFRIQIRRDLNEKLAIETLLHEFGHAKAWNHLHDFIEQEHCPLWHDASWGVAYAEVYRAFEQHYLYKYLHEDDSITK